ncbi:MAG: site-2 protease family protein [Actinomycetales bacterium]|nr:site-2 protease family protein [Actinomycetales bacterium]
MSSYVYFFLAIVPSIVLHEVSHGYVANFFGDPTAKENHRLTLNPLRHVDPFGTVLLPALLILSHLPAFGYAKPVPVNIGRLRNPRRQSLYVSLAGPIVNILLSGVGYLISELAIHVTNSSWMLQFGVTFGIVNLTLAVFNLLPIPPLDGSAIIERFVPRRHLPSYYRFRMRALPIVMVVIILDSMFFHVGFTWLTSLQNWWISLLF